MRCSVEAEPLRLNLSRYTVHADDVCVTIVGANVGDVGRVPATFYREWFVNFRFPGHEKVKMVSSPTGKVPGGWSIVSLGDLADIQWGDTSTTKAS